MNKTFDMIKGEYKIMDQKVLAVIFSALLQLSSDKIKDRGSENQYKKYKCGPVLSRTSKKQPESQR